MMNRQLEKHLNKERKVSEYLGLANFAAPGVMETLSGEYLMTLSVSGFYAATESVDELNFFKQHWHMMIKELGDEFGIYCHTLRRVLSVSLDGDFTHAFSRRVNEAYMARFKGKTYYQNELYLTLVLKGISSGVANKLSQLLKTTSHLAMKNAREQYRQDCIEKIQRKAKSIQQLLPSALTVKILDEGDLPKTHSEVLGFYGSLINGLDRDAYCFPDSAPSPVGCDLKSFEKAQKKLQRKYPRGHIGPYLPRRSVRFGRVIQLGDSEDKKFALMISLKHYSTFTSSIMFDRLLHVDGELLITTSYLPEPKDVGINRTSSKLRKMENTHDRSVTQYQEIFQLQDDLVSEKKGVGYSHFTVMVLSDDVETVRDKAHAVLKVFSESGFSGVIEGINAYATYFSQLPCNFRLITRPRLLPSDAWCDFFPMHNYPVGHTGKTHLGDALTLMETPSKTAMFFNMHSEGSGRRDELVPGHTGIYGATTSGKTTLAMLLATQLEKYGGQTIILDRDRSSEVFVMANDGVYQSFSADADATARMNPFSLDDSPSNRTFLKEWLCELVKRSEERTVSAVIMNTLSDAVDYAYDHLSRETRCLSHVVQYLPIDFERHAELKRWCRGKNGENDGDSAYLFDNIEDGMSLAADYVGFDLTAIIDKPAILNPAMMYIFYRIELSLDGRRTSIFADEGWQLLDCDYFVKKLSAILATFRKKNAHVVLITQSVESVVKSAIAGVFKTNQSTQIYSSNGKADFEHYKQFDVTHAEFEFIRDTPPGKRLWLVKQGKTAVIGAFNLSTMAEEMMVLSGNEAKAKIARDLQKQLGHKSEQWLASYINTLKARESDD